MATADNDWIESRSAIGTQARIGQHCRAHSAIKDRAEQKGDSNEWQSVYQAAKVWLTSGMIHLQL